MGNSVNSSNEKNLEQMKKKNVNLNKKPKLSSFSHNFQISSNEYILEQMKLEMFIWTKSNIFIILPQFPN